MTKTLIAVLSMALFPLAPHAKASFDLSHGGFDATLASFVKDGLVDYRGMKSNPASLNRYLDDLAAVTEGQWAAWGENDQIAFLINLYNAATLKLIVDHYPVDSIKDIGSWWKGPWKQDAVRLFGRKVTLDHVEHELLREEFDEPRIHMALVCAARGCPPLRSEPYTGKLLDRQLDEQARGYLATPKGLRLDREDREAAVSAIFDWFEEDFESVRGFIEHHAAIDLQGWSIRTIPYDWSLNEQP